MNAIKKDLVFSQSDQKIIDEAKKKLALGSITAQEFQEIVIPVFAKNAKEVVSRETKKKTTREKWIIELKKDQPRVSRLKTLARELAEAGSFSPQDASKLASFGFMVVKKTSEEVSSQQVAGTEYKVIPGEPGENLLAKMIASAIINEKGLKFEYSDTLFTLHKATETKPVRFSIMGEKGRTESIPDEIADALRRELIKASLPEATAKKVLPAPKATE